MMGKSVYFMVTFAHPFGNFWLKSDFWKNTNTNGEFGLKNHEK